MKKLQKASAVKLENLLTEATIEQYQKGCMNIPYLKQCGISDSDIDVISKLYTKMANTIGDQGSCVLGNGIKINGKIAITTYSQGSIGIERIQAKIIPYLTQRYPKLKISYEWGNMD